MPETEKQLPRPGGAGLIYSRNKKKKKDQYFQKCGGVRESEIENSQRSIEGETMFYMVLIGYGKDVIPSDMTIWKILSRFALYFYK